MKLFAVKDNKVNVFKAPMRFVNVNEFVRAHIYAAKNPQTELAQYPADFDLYEVGSMNDETGVLEPVNPVFIANLGQLVTVARNAASQAEKEIKENE